MATYVRTVGHTIWRCDFASKNVYRIGLLGKILRLNLTIIGCRLTFYVFRRVLFCDILYIISILFRLLIDLYFISVYWRGILIISS